MGGGLPARDGRHAGAHPVRLAVLHLQPGLGCAPAGAAAGTMLLAQLTALLVYVTATGLHAHPLHRHITLAPRYCDASGAATEQYPFNPNGSPDGIAALCSPDGRHLAMMPHPERCFMMWQNPWCACGACGACGAPSAGWEGGAEHRRPLERFLSAFCFHGVAEPLMGGAGCWALGAHLEQGGLWCSRAH